MDSAIEMKSKKSKCNQEEQAGNSMDSLPREIANDILLRLPVASLIQFRFVCRSWGMLSRDKHLANLHLSKNNYTCLILHSDYPIRNQLHFAEFSDLDDEKDIVVRKIHTPFCTSMPEFKVVGSCNGLLCLSDSLYNDSVYIFNPFTRDYKKLPKSTQFEAEDVVFGFGFHPAINQYKVVKIAYNRRNYRYRSRPESMAQVFSLSTNTWRSLGEVPYQLARARYEANCLVNGRLHWVARGGRHYRLHEGRIVSLDLDDEKFREVPIADSAGPKRLGTDLLVLKGCLSAAIFFPRKRLEIWTMKRYNVSESWIKEFNIDGYSSRDFGYLEDLNRSYGIWKNVLCRRMVGVLSLLNDGKILLEYRGGVLACYDPETGGIKNLKFRGMPILFQTFVHVYETMELYVFLQCLQRKEFNN